MQKTVEQGPESDGMYKPQGPRGMQQDFGGTMFDRLPQSQELMVADVSTPNGSIAAASPFDSAQDCWTFHSMENTGKIAILQLLSTLWKMPKASACQVLC